MDEFETDLGAKIKAAVDVGEAAVAGAQFDVAATLFRQNLRSTGGKFGDHLDRADLAGELREHRRLIA